MATMENLKTLEIDSTVYVVYNHEVVEGVLKGFTAKRVKVLNTKTGETANYDPRTVRKNKEIKSIYEW